jgi:hypothetical protein
VAEAIVLDTSACFALLEDEGGSLKQKMLAPK